MTAIQVDPGSSLTRVAGRFVAANYGQWSIPISKFPPGTGAQTFSVAVPYATLTDGRNIIPFSTNAPIYVGSAGNQEKVTPSAVVNNGEYGVLITATFSNSHAPGDPITSGTFGLQEALNEASAIGGGLVAIDAAWTLLGGTTTIKNAATIPASTAIDDVRVGLSNLGPTYGVNVTPNLTLTNATVSGNTAVVTGTPGSVTLAGIPATGVNLKILFYGAFAASSEFQATLNGDSTSGHYATQFTRLNGVTAPPNTSAMSAAFIHVGSIATLNSSNIIEIPFYAAATASKSLNFRNAGFGSIADNTQDYFETGAGYWTQTAAISSITFTASGTTFTAGSSFVVIVQ